MTEYEKIMEIAGESVGALSVLASFYEMPEMLDYLSEFGPHGEDLWALYKDGCGADIALFATVIADQMSERQPEVYQRLWDEAAANECERIWEAS